MYLIDSFVTNIFYSRLEWNYTSVLITVHSKKSPFKNNKTIAFGRSNILFFLHSLLVRENFPSSGSRIGVWGGSVTRWRNVLHMRTQTRAAHRLRERSFGFKERKKSCYPSHCAWSGAQFGLGIWRGRGEKGNWFPAVRAPAAHNGRCASGARETDLIAG